MDCAASNTRRYRDRKHLRPPAGAPCAICRQPMRPPQQDHCAKTGRIRGYLCRNCNLALGHFNDRIPLIRKAIQYLEKPVPVLLKK